jgi:lysophospholipase L1-like esterase
VREYAEVVALGSSFAAGPGIPPIEDRLAGRSRLNYAHLVAERLNARLVDATVAGATTATLLHDRQRVLWKRFPTQIDAVTSAADLVTITAGGNDLGYLGSIIDAALRNRLAALALARPIRRRLTRRSELPAAVQVDGAAAGLTEVVEEARHRAPGARIVLVGYLPIFGAETQPGPAVPFGRSEIDHFRALADLLSTAYDRAGRDAGAEVIRATDYDPGHALGSAEPWVFGLARATKISSSFHPNGAGMAHLADVIIDRLAVLDA